jgi:hypothetical protein
VATPSERCAEVPYTYDLAVGCNGWSGLTEQGCWTKCYYSLQAPGCPAATCAAANFYPATGWCHLVSSCSIIPSGDSTVLVAATPSPTAVITPALADYIVYDEASGTSNWYISGTTWMQTDHHSPRGTRPLDGMKSGDRADTRQQEGSRGPSL